MNINLNINVTIKDERNENDKKDTTANRDDILRELIVFRNKFDDFMLTPEDYCKLSTEAKEYLDNEAKFTCTLYTFPERHHYYKKR